MPLGQPASAAVPPHLVPIVLAQLVPALALLGSCLLLLLLLWVCAACSYQTSQLSTYPIVGAVQRNSGTADGDFKVPHRAACRGALAGLLSAARAGALHPHPPPLTSIAPLALLLLLNHPAPADGPVNVGSQQHSPQINCAPAVQGMQQDAGRQTPPACLLHCRSLSTAQPRKGTRHCCGHAPPHPRSRPLATGCRKRSWRRPVSGSGRNMDRVVLQAKEQHALPATQLRLGAHHATRRVWHEQQQGPAGRSPPSAPSTVSFRIFTMK